MGAVKMSIRDEFRTWQKDHPNFVTPDLLEIKTIGKHVVELSEGEGLAHEKIYGVTLLSREKENDFSTRVGYESGVSSAFFELNKAKSHFNKVIDAVQKCRLYEYEEDKFIDCLKKYV